jgi:hypothetical protein
MLLITKPRVKSIWIDHELDITYLVNGFISTGPSKGDVLVSCRHGRNQWLDALPLECFVTELREVR